MEKATECSGRKVKTIPQALTLTELARRAGCLHHRARFFIRSRNIQEVYRVGQYRIFSEDTLQQLCKHIDELNLQRKNALRNAGEAIVL